MITVSLSRGTVNVRAGKTSLLMDCNGLSPVQSIFSGRRAAYMRPVATRELRGRLFRYVAPEGAGKADGTRHQVLQVFPGVPVVLDQGPVLGRVLVILPHP